VIKVSNGSKSVLVVGFNTRPLAYSLSQAGYDIYAVDFFGDLDLFPLIKDHISVTKELEYDYHSLKEIPSLFFGKFAKDMLKRHKNLRYLLIGSGLDDAYEVREFLSSEIRDTQILSINNSVDVIKKARDIENIFKFLKSNGYEVPHSISFSFHLVKPTITEIWQSLSKNIKNSTTNEDIAQSLAQANDHLKRFVKFDKVLFKLLKLAQGYRRKGIIGKPNDKEKAELVKLMANWVTEFIVKTKPDSDFESSSIKLPCIIKKKRGAGGTHVYKIKDIYNYASILEKTGWKYVNPSEWLIQEYLKGLPISCTIISNGKECEVISINQQIIGEKLLNSPKKFMYCGNIVPLNLSRVEEVRISEISSFLTKKLHLKGINGFDFVLKDNYPYLMEINPRIPGSIRVSEDALGLNLLQLHIDSFDPNEWESVKQIITSKSFKLYATKLVYFAPRDIIPERLELINNLENIHDKTKPEKGVSKGEPVCTILYKAQSFQESYDGAFKIIERIKDIIKTN
jgi:predicted ATP-grasp superfamily ATP-dependent carboligase